jgi:hypothetical protein
MDGIFLGLFLLAAFVGGFASSLRRLALALLLACLVTLPAVTSVAAITCKPILSIVDVREIRSPVTPVRRWFWNASVIADTRYCATASGYFEIDFIRIKEYAPDVQFTEKYRWVSGQFVVTVELSMDEAIHEHRIGFVAPCVCREVPFN